MALEHWQKLLVGSVVGSALTVAFFFIFDLLLKRYRLHSPKTASPATIKDIRLVSKAGSGGQKERCKSAAEEEVAKLIYEDYRSDHHDVLTVVVFDEGKFACICAFLNEMRIEFAIEGFPFCCVNNCNDLAKRSFLGCVSAFAPEWTGSDDVVVLTQDKSLVAQLNDPGKRGQLKKLEEKFGFKADIQWTENFYCHDVSSEISRTCYYTDADYMTHSSLLQIDFEELWEEMIIFTRKLLAQETSDPMWAECPLGHWERRRVKLTSEHCHVVPHAGKKCSEPTAEAEPLIQLL